MPLNKQRDGARFFLFKRLASAANGHSMNVDGSVTPVEYEYTVPVGKDAVIHRCNIDIVDGGIGYGEFAGLGSDLTNGLLVEIIDTDGSTVILDFLDGHPIKSNSHWVHLAGVDAIASQTAGDDTLPIRWSIDKANAAIGMTLSEDEIFRVTVRDDLREMTHFQWVLQGKIY